MRLAIVQVNRWYSGAEKIMARCVLLARSMNWEIIIVGQRPSNKFFDGYELIPAPEVTSSSELLSVHTWINYLSAMRTAKADMVLTFSRLSHPFSLTGVIFGVPIVWHMQDIYSALDRILIRMSSLFVRRIICVSNAVANEFGKSRTSVIYNYVNNDRRRETKEQGRNKVTFIGQLVQWKGVGIFLDAIEIIRRDYPHFVYDFCIAGASLDGGDSFGDIIINRCKELGVSYLGYLSEVEELLESSLLVVVPSIMPDPAPLVVMEAMVHGCAVIGSRIGGIPELLNPYSNNFTFEPGNHNELAALIIKYTKESMQPMIRELSDICMSRFSQHRFEKEWIDIIQEMMR